MSQSSSVAVAALGTPRIGPRRELKTALESFWAGRSDEQSQLETAAGLRAANRARQKAQGITVIPSNDFSFCGLKTRKWDEVRPALVNMIEAARTARSAGLSEGGSAGGAPALSLPANNAVYIRDHINYCFY